MAPLSAQIVYVDDSGTESRARLVVSAFCVSTEDKWRKFDAAWQAAEKEEGFQHSHMTEFAGCRKRQWCRECTRGQKTEVEHPWREWSNSKRKQVLKRLVGITCRYTEQGFGIAFTKEELEQHVMESQQLKAKAPRAWFGKKHFTFAATACGG